MINFFSNVFGYVLNWIYFLVQNYGLAIIIFSVLIKILMLPLSISQQKNLKKNEKIQKQMKILKVKHNGNQEKLNQEMMELYKREKVSPFGGCFTIILQIILMISMFFLVQSPLTYMKKLDSNTINEYKEKIEGTARYPEVKIISEYGKDNEDVNLNMNFLGLDLSLVPQENLKDARVYIIPVLYVISSFFSIKFTTNMTAGKAKEKEEETKKQSLEMINGETKKEFDQEEMSLNMNKNMSYILPVLSVSISIIAPLGLGLYWLVNNIIMIAERIVLNKMFAKGENEDA